jgi:ribonuclease-3
MKEISALLEQLKIVPKNLSIYEEAFTHSSYQNDKKLSYSYERYEFLGDALIQKIVSEHLFKKHPNMNEGDMSKSRSMIVQTSTESRAGEDLGLRACIKVGDSVIHSNGISEKIMEDVFEAFVAAVYLDQGEKEVYKIIKRTVIHYFEINSLNDSRD